MWTGPGLLRRIGVTKVSYAFRECPPRGEAALSTSRAGMQKCRRACESRVVVLEEMFMNDDVQHLSILSIFHYVCGGIVGLFACLPVLHLSIGGHDAFRRRSSTSQWAKACHRRWHP